MSAQHVGLRVKGSVGLCYHAKTHSLMEEGDVYQKVDSAFKVLTKEMLGFVC